jgi:hypothetical protein
VLLSPWSLTGVAPAREAVTSRPRLRGGSLGAPSARWLVVAAATVAVLGAGLAAGAQTVPLHLGVDSAEDSCERVRASFERTNRLGRELAAVLDSLGSEGTVIVAGRLAGVRDGLQQEASALGTMALPPGAGAAQTRGAAVVALLLEIADPALTEVADADREELGNRLRDQFLAARTEARAAAAVLRQGDSGCANRRLARDSMHLLGRQH